MDKLLLTVAVVTASATGVAVLGAFYRWAVRDSPRTRTSAAERLVERNPAIMFNDVRWSVESRRVRFGWLTGAAVAVALLVIVDRPVQRATR